ncbi:MAG: hypothetical protein HKN08_06490 [Gammaproteobacteria bacterium]|nr:hypothetical protein [Gammaproteobacteria bacterium]
MSEEQTKSKRTSRIELMILILVFMAPIFGAWIIYAYTDIGRGENINHGELLEPPVMLQDVSLDYYSNASNAGNLLGKWSLIYIMPGVCEGPCEEQIEMQRKLKLSLANNSHRLQLIIAHSGKPGSESGPGLTSQISWGDIPAMSVTEDFKVAVAGTSLPGYVESDMLLMDPAGNLMMRYNKDSDGAGILQDIKRLLRYSIID